MNFVVGDFVAVLDDVVKGTITSINGLNVFIEDDTGMLFSYLPSELVKLDENQHEMTTYSDINNQFLQDKIAEKQKKNTLNFSKAKNEVVFEVDLHINQLVNSTNGLDNYDMLTIQLETAKRKLEYAIQKRISKIIFIHGVGEGVLKAELVYLFKKYPVEYYDASYQKYGLGATEVAIFQKPN
ncbi:Endonuclease MutS2 [Polaribacter huanghezhanensis]|uniref:DNA mismatch repair protein MutS n=1 Tax=Polaribacter huanghezhanensis TaxID=1354726 RepID=UPI00264812C4|nr:DNA mismatch repair protein MutS [Polaribacter huanghezhanensis]WKD86784.1 Endonuclease MutS2 [Polaribacter huanghezhanensis]